jgi:hypothetical protein
MPIDHRSAEPPDRQVKGKKLGSSPSFFADQ